MLNTILSIPTYSEPDTATIVFLIVIIVLLGLGILGTLVDGIYGLVAGDDDMARELLTMSKLDMAARLVMLERRVKELERLVTILRP